MLSGPISHIKECMPSERASMMRNAVHTPESHAESTTYDSAKPESGYTKSLALSNDPPPCSSLNFRNAVVSMNSTCMASVQIWKRMNLP